MQYKEDDSDDDHAQLKQQAAVKPHMTAAAMATTLAFARVDRIAAWLFVPYLAWLCFATILNFQILQLNQ